MECLNSAMSKLANSIESFQENPVSGTMNDFTDMVLIRAVGRPIGYGEIHQIL